MVTTHEDRVVAGSPAAPRSRRSAAVVAAAVVALAAGAALAGNVPPVTALRVTAPAPTRVTAVRDDVPATPMDESFKPANNSPTLVADPSDGRFVVEANRLDGPDFSCALQVSGDGGASWIGTRPMTKLPPGADKCYAPEAAFDRTGRLFYLFVGLAGKGNQPHGRLRDLLG